MLLLLVMVLVMDMMDRLLVHTEDGLSGGLWCLRQQIQ
jgi:hypothetical protein